MSLIEKKEKTKRGSSRVRTCRIDERALSHGDLQLSISTAQMHARLLDQPCGPPFSSSSSRCVRCAQERTRNVGSRESTVLVVATRFIDCVHAPSMFTTMIIRGETFALSLSLLSSSLSSTSFSFDRERKTHTRDVQNKQTVNCAFVSLLSIAIIDYAGRLTPIQPSALCFASYCSIVVDIVASHTAISLDDESSVAQILRRQRLRAQHASVQTIASTRRQSSHSFELFRLVVVDIVSVGLARCRPAPADPLQSASRSRPGIPRVVHRASVR